MKFETNIGRLDDLLVCCAKISLGNKPKQLTDIIRIIEDKPLPGEPGANGRNTEVGHAILRVYSAVSKMFNLNLVTGYFQDAKRRNYDLEGFVRTSYTELGRLAKIRNHEGTVVKETIRRCLQILEDGGIITRKRVAVGKRGTAGCTFWLRFHIDSAWAACQEAKKRRDAIGAKGRRDLMKTVQMDVYSNIDMSGNNIDAASTDAAAGVSEEKEVHPSDGGAPFSEEQTDCTKDEPGQNDVVEMEPGEDVPARCQYMSRLCRDVAVQDIEVADTLRRLSRHFSDVDQLTHDEVFKLYRIVKQLPERLRLDADLLDYIDLAVENGSDLDGWLRPGRPVADLINSWHKVRYAINEYRFTVDGVSRDHAMNVYAVNRRCLLDPKGEDLKEYGPGETNALITRMFSLVLLRGQQKALQPGFMSRVRQTFAQAPMNYHIFCRNFPGAKELIGFDRVQHRALYSVWEEKLASYKAWRSVSGVLGMDAPFVSDELLTC